MRNFSNFILLMLVLSVASFKSRAQTAPVIGNPANTFVLFSSIGALTNEGESIVTGNIGTNAGDYSGFNTAVLLGSSHVADEISAAAVSQVANAFASFDANVCPPAIPPTLGNGQVLTAGIYCVGEASTITGSLTLDAQSNPDAIFIIKIGGALTTAALSNVLLVNGAQLSNVYWRIDGALTTGENSFFRGTVLSSGAIEFLSGASFQGRALTTAGAITLNNNQINGEVPLPVVLTKFNAEPYEKGSVLISWSTASEKNSEHFEVQHSFNGKDWKELGLVAAKGESAAILSYSFSHTNVSRGANYYRLKMIDKDQTFAYSRIRSVELRPSVSLVMYPNPTLNNVTLQVEEIELVQRIQLIDILGITVFDRQKTGLTNIGSQIDMKQYPSGAYVARVTALNGTVSSVRLLKL